MWTSLHNQSSWSYYSPSLNSLFILVRPTPIFELEELEKQHSKHTHTVLYFLIHSYVPYLILLNAIFKIKIEIDPTAVVGLVIISPYKNSHFTLLIVKSLVDG